MSTSHYLIGVLIRKWIGSRPGVTQTCAQDATAAAQPPCHNRDTMHSPNNQSGRIWIFPSTYIFKCFKMLFFLRNIQTGCSINFKNSAQVLVKDILQKVSTLFVWLLNCNILGCRVAVLHTALCFLCHLVLMDLAWNWSVLEACDVSMPTPQRKSLYYQVKKKNELSTLVKIHRELHL